MLEQVSVGFDKSESGCGWRLEWRSGVLSVVWTLAVGTLHRQTALLEAFCIRLPAAKGARPSSVLAFQPHNTLAVVARAKAEGPR